MKKSKNMNVMNYFRSFLILALIGFVAGCTEEENSLNTEKRFVDQSWIELYAGQGAGSKSQVQINTVPDGKNYTWTSMEPKVATVNQTGLISAVKEGVAVITAASENDLTNIIVIVNKWIPLVGFEIEDIDFDEVDDEGEVVTPLLSKSLNDMFQLVAINLVPENATEMVQFISDATDVVVVLENGWLSCVGGGKAQITARTASGFTLKLQVEVNVSDFGTIDMPENITFVKRVPDSQISFPGYNQASSMGTIGYSSQQAQDNGGGEGGPINGRVAAMLMENNDFWHARWQSPSGVDNATYPHWFIVDLGENTVISGVMLAKRVGNNGTAEGYYMYTCPDVAVDQDDPEDGYPWVLQGDFTFDRNNDSPQTKWLTQPLPTARYVKIYLDPKHRGGSGQYAMFRRFGLYTLAE